MPPPFSWEVLYVTKIEMIKEATKDLEGGFWEANAGEVVAAVLKRWPGTHINKQHIHTARSDQRKRDKKVPSTRFREAKLAVAGASQVTVPKPLARPSVLVADLRQMVLEWGWSEVRDVLEALNPELS